MAGVQMTPPPAPIRKQIEDLVRREARTSMLEPGQKGALVAVTDRTGVNVAVVGKTKFGFEVQGWFAKKWSGDIQLEARVVKVW